MEETRWILCPKCGEKTRVKIKKTTIMKDFLLFCHHCKRETTVDVENFVIKVVKKTNKVKIRQKMSACFNNVIIK